MLALSSLLSLVSFSLSLWRHTFSTLLGKYLPCHSFLMLMLGWLCSEMLFALVECGRIFMSFSTTSLTNLLSPLRHKVSVEFFGDPSTFL